MGRSELLVDTKERRYESKKMASREMGRYKDW
jgi:hypothetical protein